MPSASFGSNQVDFGGMIPPRVGDRHQVGHLGRIECKGDRHVAGRDPAFEFGEAARATDEIDAFVGPLIGDAEERLEHMARQQRDRQPSDRIALGDELGPQRQPVPAAVEIHAELRRSGRTYRPIRCRNREAFPQLGEERFRAAAVEVAYNPVVVQDRHLVMRKQHREKMAVRRGKLSKRGRASSRSGIRFCGKQSGLGSLPGLAGGPRPGLQSERAFRAAARCPLRLTVRCDPRSGRRAVMPVADIEGRQGVDRARQRPDGGIVGDHPKLMAHAVVSYGGHVGRTAGRAPPAWRRSPGRRDRPS